LVIVKASFIAFENASRTAFEDRSGGGRFETLKSANGQIESGVIPLAGIIFLALPP